MSWPSNTELYSDIIQDDFFEALESATTQRYYPRLTTEKSQDAIVTTFTSLGSVPEPRQMSGVAGGSNRQAVMLKDWTLTSTVNEHESTIYRRRIVAESRPEDTASIAKQMAFKAEKSLDRQLCTALVSTTALGYDGVALISAAHPESGASQDNTDTTNIGTPAVPTPAEAELALNGNMALLLGYQDDQGTPVNEGVTRYTILCSMGMYWPFMAVTSEKMSKQAVDASGVSGRYRGLIDVIPSAYCTDSGLTGGNADVYYLFAQPEQAQDRAVALCRMVDWQFNNNIGDTGSDDWNKGEGFLRSYGVHVMVPWKWQNVLQHTFT